MYILAVEIQGWKCEHDLECSVLLTKQTKFLRKKIEDRTLSEFIFTGIQ